MSTKESLDPLGAVLLIVHASNEVFELVFDFKRLAMSLTRNEVRALETFDGGMITAHNRTPLLHVVQDELEPIEASDFGSDENDAIILFGGVIAFEWTATSAAARLRPVS